MIELPVVDLQHYKATGDRNECLKAAESLHKYGVLCLRDEVRARLSAQRCRPMANFLGAFACSAL